MGNRFMEKYASRIGETGVKSEGKTAQRMGAKQVRGSGASYYGLNADARVGDFALECKSTVNQSISVKHEWLKKISKAALGEKKIPALTVTFTDQAGNPKSNGAWVMVPEYILRELVNEGR